MMVKTDGCTIFPHWPHKTGRKVFACALISVLQKNGTQSVSRISDTVTLKIYSTGSSASVSVALFGRSPLTYEMLFFFVADSTCSEALGISNFFPPRSFYEGSKKLVLKLADAEQATAALP